MLVAFILTLAALFAAVAAYVRREQTFARDLLRASERDARLRERRENLLLNRLAHAYDKPYEEAPIDQELAAVLDPDEEDDDDVLVWDLSHAEHDEVLSGSGGTY